MIRFVLVSLAALFAAFSMTGCLATFDGKLDNRIVCTVAGEKLYALSEWGPVSFGSRISDLDRKVVCPEPAAKPAAPAASAAK